MLKLPAYVVEKWKTTVRVLKFKSASEIQSFPFFPLLFFILSVFFVFFFFSVVVPYVLEWFHFPAEGNKFTWFSDHILVPER